MYWNSPLFVMEGSVAGICCKVKSMNSLQSLKETGHSRRRLNTFIKGFQIRWLYIGIFDRKLSISSFQQRSILSILFFSTVNI